MQIIPNARLKQAARRSACRLAGSLVTGRGKIGTGDKAGGPEAPQDRSLEELERLFDQPGNELVRLARALRTERRLGLAGHWSYDLNRHIALAQSYRLELEKAALQKRRDRKNEDAK